MTAPAHIFITGASSGIGAALARSYARNGIRLSLLARNAEKLAQVARECQSAGATVDWKTIDVVSSESVRVWIEECEAMTPIDMVIANAGIGGERVIAPFSGEAPGVAREIVDTNILG
ncbi:MAG TPA: SDR family NAD(P)-dependent oxidoreductase, partial [Rhizomicrobium sp.]